MNVYGIQMDLAWEDKRANFQTARRLIAAAQPPPGSLVVLPELFATGFSMHVEAIAEAPGGETGQFLSRTAREFGVYLAGGVAARTATGKGRNEALLYGPDGSIQARYAKAHVFNPAGEGEHYECGTAPVLAPWQEEKLALFVCYDLRFPEVFRLAALQGATVAVVIANWPTVRIGHWMTLLQARAIENQMFVVGVNRCGQTPKLAYDGRSLIVDPLGKILADGGTAEGVIQATLDHRMLEQWRQEFPVLADTRAEHFSACHLAMKRG